MRNMLVRILFNLTDAGQIRQTRQMINTAVSRFEVYILNFVLSLLLRPLLGSFPYNDQRTSARSCHQSTRTIARYEKSQYLGPAGGGERGGGGGGGGGGV